jgi:hypothetical protein
MERIEVPAASYWKSKYGRKFSNAADCEKYELLMEKWMLSAGHATIVDSIGRLCTCYFINTRDELFEVVWLTKYTHHYQANNPWAVASKAFEPGWFVCAHYDNEYDAGFQMQTIDEFIDDCKEILQDAQKAVEMATHLKEGSNA